MHAPATILALVGLAAAATIPPTATRASDATSTVTCQKTTSTLLNFTYCKCSNFSCYDVTKNGNCNYDEIEAAPEPPLFCPSS